MCPIWPSTSYAKAALFNKYGRGIIHMGLHVGVEKFEYGVGGRKRGRLPYKQVNALEHIMHLDMIEDEIDIEPVEMVSVVVEGQFNSSVYVFNGTGDDWRLLTWMIINGDFGPAVLFDVRTRLSSTVPSAFYQFALSIDDVIDKSSAIRFQRSSVGNADAPTIRGVVYPGPGQHKFQLAFVVESAASAQVSYDRTKMRLTGLLDKRG